MSNGSLQQQQLTQSTYSAYNPEQPVKETPVGPEQLRNSVDFVTSPDTEVLAAREAVRLAQGEVPTTSEVVHQQPTSEQMAYVDALSQQAQVAAEGPQIEVPADLEVVTEATYIARDVSRTRIQTIKAELEEGGYAFAA